MRVVLYFASEYFGDFWRLSGLVGRLSSRFHGLYFLLSIVRRNMFGVVMACGSVGAMVKALSLRTASNNRMVMK